MEKENNNIVEPEVIDTPNEEKEDKVQELFSDYVMKLPESEKDKPKVIEDPNRPAHWSQRIAAGIVDLCILFLSIWGLYQLFVSTAFKETLLEETQTLQEVVDYYKTVPLVSGSDETYGYKMYDDNPDYENDKYKDYTVYTEEDTGYKYKVVDHDVISDAVKTAYQNAVNNNQKYTSAVFNYRLKDFGVLILAGGIGELVFLLAIPLLNKNRATIGKWAAGLMVINYKYQTPAKWYQMVGRYIWTLSIESAIPVLFLPSIGSFSNIITVVLVMPLLIFLITLVNKDRRTLHDYVCRTMVIDKRTYVPLNEQ